MDCSTPGFPIHHQLPKLAQTHVHPVSDAISSSVIPFSWLQSFPASGSFPVSQFFSLGGRSIGVSASASVLPMNTQHWSPLGWTGLISLLSKGLSRVFFNTTILKHHFFSAQLSLWPNSHIHIWLLEKPYHWLYGPTIALIKKQMSLLFNMWSRLVIVFLARSKCLISWLQSPSAVILKRKKMKSVTVSTFSPSICHEVMGPDAMILVFWMLSFKPGFSLSSFTFIKRLFISSSFSAIRVVLSVHLRLLILLPAILTLACTLCSPAFHMMYSEYKLNRQGDSIQPWRTPFPILNQSVVPCPVLTVASWPAQRFLRRQVR